MKKLDSNRTIVLIFILMIDSRGEQGHATDFYARGKIKPKEYLKLRGEGQDCAKRLGKYTQSFVCAAVNLFPDGADMSESPKRIVLDNLTRLSGGDMSDDVVFTEVRALLGKGSVGDEVKGFLTGRSRRLKPLPGKFVIEVQKVKSGERLPNRVTTGLAVFKSSSAVIESCYCRCLEKKKGAKSLVCEMRRDGNVWHLFTKGSIAAACPSLSTQLLSCAIVSCRTHPGGPLLQQLLCQDHPRDPAILAGR